MNGINEFNLASSVLSCPNEFKKFKESFMWLQRVEVNLDAVRDGRWTEKDVQSVITSENIGRHLSHEELVALRISGLEKEEEKASCVAVKRLNALNRAFYEASGNYILGFQKNRDERLKELLKNLSKVG